MKASKIEQSFLAIKFSWHYSHFRGFTTSPVKSGSSLPKWPFAWAPVKSQPLHNFVLCLLKWGKNTSTATHHQRHRCPSHPPNHTYKPNLHSRPHHIGSRTARNRFFLPLKPSPSHKTEHDDDSIQKPWNLYPWKHTLLPKVILKIDTKPSSHTTTMPATTTTKNSTMMMTTLHRSHSGSMDTKCMEKKEKRKFWMALSHEEIEEYIFLFFDFEFFDK